MKQERLRCDGLYSRNQQRVSNKGKLNSIPRGGSKSLMILDPGQDNWEIVSACVCLGFISPIDHMVTSSPSLSLSNTLVKRKKATRLRHILKRSGFIIFAANSWCYHLLQGRASFFRVERIITATTTYRHTHPHTPKTTAGEEGCVSEQEKKNFAATGSKRNRNQFWLYVSHTYINKVLSNV